MRFSHKTSGQQTNISYEKTELKLSNYKKQNRGQFRTKETKIVQEKEEKQKENKNKQINHIKEHFCTGEGLTLIM